jgi:hypothetical protein
VGWIVGYTIASIAASFVAVRIFDLIFGAATGSLASTARAGVFVTTWTAVTAKSGMNGFTSRVRKLRQGNAKASKQINALTKRDRQ